MNLIPITYNSETVRCVLTYFAVSINNYIPKGNGGGFINSGKTGKEEDGFYPIYVRGIKGHYLIGCHKK